MKKIDWDFLKTKLQYERWQPMYNCEIHRYLNSLLKEPYADQQDLPSAYLKTFHNWIQSSRLNRLEGLDGFPYRDCCIGVTHYLDDLHIQYGNHLVILEKEYKYHLRIKPQIRTKKIDDLRTEDVLVLSLPFCNSGNIHSDIDLILHTCQQKQIPLHIDSAWFGACRDIVFDYSHPVIQSVSFSLSKGLGLGQHRAGIRYSKKRTPGPITIINDFNLHIQSSLWLGLKFMQKFSPDYLQNKYYENYQMICDKLKLKPSSTIFVAYEKNSDNDYWPVGIRPILRWISEGRY